MQPLAERMRPHSLDDYIGQRHLVGPNAVLRQMVERRRVSSFILWGPPGVGKTTLANIVASQLDVPFFKLSAVTSGVKDVREVIEQARKARFFNQMPPILFIDEIHRFSKSQQDSLLGAVEKGDVTLIGATTENPSFEVITPLLSRCQVYTLEPLSADDLLLLAHRAIERDPELSRLSPVLAETDALLRFAGGDARKLLNIIELVSNAGSPSTPVPAPDSAPDSASDAACAGLDSGSGSPSAPHVLITNQSVISCLQQNPNAYDKDGEMHYDIISAFIKSIRGSDPDAAVYWLARMIDGGEDPKFIARRLVISASEDVGLANPNALLLANAAFDAVSKIGWPEGRIPLAEATIYLASSPKSNSAYNAVNSALQVVSQTGSQPVPLHLRNAPTKLMKNMGYGADYKYPHDFQGHFVPQQYLPSSMLNQRFWHPQQNQHEDLLSQQMRRCWGNRFDN